MAVSEIRHGVFIGSLTSLRNAQLVGFTHILSVMRDAPLLRDLHPMAVCKQLRLEVDDEENEDLLRWFPSAVAFITTALSENGKILVHCVAGMSRSPTIVAAYLMAAERLDATTALTSITALRGIVKPNEGFLTQLRVWEEMGCTIQEAHPYVRQKALEALSERQLAGDSVDKEALAKPDDSAAAQKTLYRCRKCRALVATSANVAPGYLVKASPSAAPRFSGKRLNSQSSTETAEDSQLFVEPMQWMEEVVEGRVQGKLYCPGCNARLGAFNWAGMQNSRGAWITPAFELQLSRLDEVSPEMTLLRVHRPSLQ